MTAVLIVEDSTQLAQAVADQLQTWRGFTVACAADPHAMRACLAQQTFDVVLIDLLYNHLDQDFDKRRQAHQVGLSSPSLLVTGLTAIQTVNELAPGTPTAIWTSGEANRRLHIPYAYEELNQRVFCSKSSGTMRADAVAQALNAATNHLAYFDPVLTTYLPAPGAPTIASTLLRDDAKRAIWRAVALGEHTRAAIATVTGYAAHYIGNQIPTMYSDLRLLDPGLPESRQALAEIIRYAAGNWQFFLDEAVRRAYP